MNKGIKTLRRLFVIAGFLLAAWAVPAYGQLPLSEGPTADKSQSEADRDLEERIAYQRMLSTIAERNRAKRDPKLALAQLQEDFKGIQAANLELVRANSKPGVPDYKFYADSAAEIKKRAARLKVNLVLPVPEKPAEQTLPQLLTTPEQLKKSVLALGKLVYGFVKSPFFKELDVVNQQTAMKVSQDLEQIMQLSEQIKKSSESLNKSAKK